MAWLAGRRWFPARRYRRPRPWAFIGMLLGVSLLVALRLYQQQAQPRPPELLLPGRYRVARVVDGDTLLLVNHARVRLIGVDTPETKRPETPVEPWGPEATAFTEDFVRAGEVELTFDRERTDRYGRFLAYVWVDGRLLNEELLRAGLGRALLRFPYSSAMKTRFRRAADKARGARRGLWSDSSAGRTSASQSAPATVRITVPGSVARRAASERPTSRSSVPVECAPARAAAALGIP